ncbi:phage minor head protein [Chryseobacterium sp. PBS4-4]|uniref:Phage minor head protein n=1 Tax=Chryseobacterium edaphi TaxID=2976532 RepID=A0ABT2W4J2_9FLAO|nr:phage minor head protein [Chryseobacterium edaphi]MCU7615650.1 phage minor head protein [Chryseobacterium edaphi]
MYSHECEVCGGFKDLSDFYDLGDPPLDPIYEQITRDLLAGRITPINAALHLQTAAKLNKAIEVSEKPTSLEPYLKRNIYHFSAAKSFAQMQYYRDGMVDENGNIKSFQTFRKWVANAGEMFNERHLKVEYDMAHSSALMAQSWDEMDSELIEFSTAGDRRVRPKHALLDKFTAPKSDPIWRRICPPLDWGCRCIIVPGNPNTKKKLTNTEAYNIVKEDVKGTVFENNSAVSKIIFNDKHPYFQNANGKEKQLSWSQYGMEPITKIKTRELEIFQNRESGANEAIKSPHESWMNPDKGTTNHVRYYEDKTVIVTIGKDNEVEKIRVIGISRESTINQYRKGVLMHRE